MSRDSLYSLAEELRPHIEGKDTVMRTTVDVVKQVGSPFITLVTKVEYGRQLMLSGIPVKLYPKLPEKRAKRLPFISEESTSSFHSLKRTFVI